MKLMDIYTWIRINQFDDWATEELDSEAAFYRRFAVLLDSLFRNTKIKIREYAMHIQILGIAVAIIKRIINRVLFL